MHAMGPFDYQIHVADLEWLDICSVATPHSVKLQSFALDAGQNVREYGFVYVQLARTCSGSL